MGAGRSLGRRMPGGLGRSCSRTYAPVQSLFCYAQYSLLPLVRQPIAWWLRSRLASPLLARSLSALNFWQLCAIYFTVLNGRAFEPIAAELGSSTQNMLEALAAAQKDAATKLQTAEFVQGAGAQPLDHHIRFLRGYGSWRPTGPSTRHRAPRVLLSVPFPPRPGFEQVAPRLAGGIIGSTSAHSASVRSLGYRRPRRSAARRVELESPEKR